jgi:uncharacterized protein YacL
MKYLNTILILIVIFILIFRKLPSLTLKRSRRVILDTCALIDGRIIDLAKSGFIPDELIIPKFVVHELQLLADGSDAHKRSRARYGLDVVNELKTGLNYKVTISNLFFEDHSATDDKLIKLALKIKAPLYTTDYNLNKVAEISGVTVLNVNELAQQLRPEILPGEKTKVKILQKGTNRNQGVGYLDDGSMVVIDNAIKFIGKTVEVEIIKSLQSPAGKMFFAELIH